MFIFVPLVGIMTYNIIKMYLISYYISIDTIHSLQLMKKSICMDLIVFGNIFSSLHTQKGAIDLHTLNKL